MTHTGEIVRWDADRGFGFIRPAGGGQDVFVHQRACQASLRPAVGLRVSYELFDNYLGKGPRAVDVRPAGAAAPAGRPAARRSRPPREAAALPRPAWPGLALAALGAGLVAWGMVEQRLPPITPLIALLLSLVTFFVYWGDKQAATRGAWRTPESSLHLLSLAGGWPGAWWAQTLLRHKSSKRAFLSVYWATVLLNVGALVAWIRGAIPAGLLPGQA
ncbi:MAG TPA: cold shock and DUF1294 domain-containing protein [Methylibium sp.]|nr:cold shock and DUF1294 domain-containing protein [Methylibium sp.]